MATIITNIAQWAEFMLGNQDALLLAWQVLADTPHASALGSFLGVGVGRPISRWCSCLMKWMRWSAIR